MKSSFNPTLVRLRLWRKRARRTGALPFQSHAGSIEAAGPKGPAKPKRGFQSHAGSIEAWWIISLR